MAKLVEILLTTFKAKKHNPSFKKQVKQLIGSNPDNLDLYLLSLTHHSIGRQTPSENIQFENSNQRLEYLGDAVLGTVIAEFLFKRFPLKDEGFLTEIRSRLVNGESLASLCKKIGLSQLVQYDKRGIKNVGSSSIYGDALEAFIGAVYLDKGFKFCRKFILKKLIEPHFDLANVVENNTNFKSQYIEWAQKQGKRAVFQLAEDETKAGTGLYTIHLYLDGELASIGKGLGKKKAEQDAARRALEQME